MGNSLKANPLVSAHFEGRVVAHVRLSYLIYLPIGYETNRKRYPLLLFLHGAGERGSDLEMVKLHGPPKEIANGRDLPFIVIAPQCPAFCSWDPFSLTGLLNDIEKRYRVDRSREYVTGLSLGGYGTYMLAAYNPGRFAAVAPICGGADPANAPQFKNCPVWAIHGDKDSVVPIQGHRKMVRALRSEGFDVKFTIVKGGGHDVWTDAYVGEDLYVWLLSHKREGGFKAAHRQPLRSPVGRRSHK